MLGTYNQARTPVGLVPKFVISWKVFLGKLLAEEVEEVLVVVEVLVVELVLDVLVLEVEEDEVLAGRHWLYQALE